MHTFGVIWKYDCFFVGVGVLASPRPHPWPQTTLANRFAFHVLTYPATGLGDGYGLISMRLNNVRPHGKANIFTQLNRVVTSPVTAARVARLIFRDSANTSVSHCLVTRVLGLFLSSAITGGTNNSFI